MDLATVVSILGALGIGSVVTQHFAGSRDRRQIRAEVLTRLAEVESARWAASGDAPTIDDFMRVVHSFETAALIARIPREAVQQYVFYAFAGRSRSQDGVESDRMSGDFDPEYSGALNAAFADVVDDEAHEIAALVWAPLRSRYRLSHRLRKRRDAAVPHVPAGCLKHAESALGPLPPTKKSRT
ncbi:hypothetical protein SEA_OPIE_32 [Gordonia phage Opie]|nr:hypothetical protein SEA_OPIE_32 [Gordonia phage Opie]